MSSAYYAEQLCCHCPSLPQHKGIYPWAGRPGTTFCLMFAYFPSPESFAELAYNAVVSRHG
jgi:hypothetical protein